MSARTFTITFVAVVLALFANTICAAPAGAEGTAEGDMKSGGQVLGSAFSRDPASGVWTTMPVGIPDDPFGYRFEPVCFDDLEGNVDCLAGNQAACTAGENGRLVYWFKGLRTVDPAMWPRLNDSPSCIYSEEPVDVGQQIQQQILTAFQERPIAAGELVLQPSPHTLVGMDTNVYLNATEQVFEMVLLEQTVRIVATPTEYEITYGDGTVYGPTSIPGASLPQDRWGEQTQTSHKYSASGDYQVTATVHFSGSYSVNGGPMIPIDGRAAVSSPAQTLRVWRAETRSVADNCLINPNGVGC